MRFSFLAALCVLLPVSLFARLGASSSDLIARYGPPVKQTSETVGPRHHRVAFAQDLLFRHGDWNITCVLVGDRCVRVSYHKPGSWTTEQFQEVLLVNGLDGLWKATVKKPFSRDWTQAWALDSGVVVQCDWDGDFVLTSSEYGAAKLAEEIKFDRPKVNLPPL